ncbi:uncharacterized protein LOC135848370 [Planococcus citri]|uniref:uncharacterized protein LOC135848370 n=1 Tax=Planococcus citri TaxID=170843 RepID=UPI0031F818BA
MALDQTLESEFNIWLENLNTSVAAVTNALATTPVNIEQLRNSFDEMEVDASQLEGFRPISKKTLPYDFTQALGPLASAKRLSARANRVLVKAGEIIVQPSTPPVSNNIARKIPEIEITPFDGDITQFSSFMEAFQLKYGNVPIAKSEKLQHLKSLLTGGPSKVIAHLKLSDQNFDLAIASLKAEYENEKEVVSALYIKLDNLPRARNTTASISETYYELEGLLTALKSHGQKPDEYAPLRDKVYFKYPFWLVQKICIQSKPSISEFQVEVLKYVQLRNSLEASAKAHNIVLNEDSRQHAVTAALVTSTPPTSSHYKPPTSTSKQDRPIPFCVFCKQKHYSNECTAFPTATERRNQLKDRCYRCLSKEHRQNACTKNVTCRFCKQMNRHHASLCLAQYDKKDGTPHSNKPPITETASGTSGTSDTDNKHTNEKSVNFVRTHQGAHTTALLTVINPTNQRKYNARILFDNGSNDTYISETAARRLGLKLSKFQTTPVKVFAVDQPIKIRTASTSFILSNNKEFNVQVVADTIQQVPQGVHLFEYSSFIESYPQHADKKFINPGKTEPIDILLGSDYYFDIIKPESKITVNTGLHLFNTPFGWMLVGRQASNSHQKSALFQMSPSAAIKQLCELDSLGIKEPPLSEIQQEQIALEQFYKNIEFTEKRYQIRWPWKDFPPSLPDNFGLAVGRLKSLQRKLTDENFNEYNNIIETQLKAGIIEEVNERIEKSAVQVHYLPHHPIITPEKTTSLRIVYDGSAKVSKTAKSINDLIYKGSNLLANGCGIILRVRLHTIALISDIEKAFHQLMIHPTDRDFVRFLWLHDHRLPATGKNLRILRFARILFGIIASPFILNATVRYHLQKYAKIFYKVVLLILRDIYVDNVITGVPEKKEAIEFYHNAVKIFEDCSMNLRSWSTNSEEVRAAIPPEKYNSSKTVSILGVSWNPYRDVLKIQSMHVNEKCTTMRQVVSEAAMFFDPCGWFVPLLISAKIFIQKLHVEKYDWDDIISENYVNQWKQIRQELILATQTTLKRFQFEMEDISSEFELHAFSDASEKAYACCIYVRKKVNDEVQTFFIMAKAKIAPIKPDYSIPQLELFAVILAVKTILYLRDTLHLQFKKQIVWCDSKCVLSWILNNKILPVFIQRRIDFINNVDNLEFRYIPTHENPADISTREITFEKLQTSRWFQGPDWLIKNSEIWPPPFLQDNTVPEPDNNEPKATVLHTTTTVSSYPFGIDPEKYSSYLKLLRITTYMTKFVADFNYVKIRKIFPTRHTLYSAQQLWIKAEQLNHYYDVFAALREKKSHKLISKLNLFIDDEAGLLRCGGRFKYAPLSPNEKAPILLPRANNSSFVKLLIQHEHELLFHSGTSYTLHSIRRRFWIPSGRRAVFNIIQNCPKCKRFIARPFDQPQRSDLPSFRLQNMITPFQNVGIDTFGPIYVNNVKRYVVIVTDLIIRAIELELLPDMTTEEVFLALRRVFARRSTPHLILSDNAPQFKAVERAFQDIFTHEWKWKYIPEHSPWMGGAYERLIGLTKNALFKTFHNVALNESLIRTALAEIASMLNGRPLTYVSADSAENELVLAPNHFLKTHFEEENHSVTAEQLGKAEHVIKLWKQANEIGDKFWSMWKTSYLQHLRNQSLVHHFPKKVSKKQPKMGDIVLIAEKNIKRNNWKMGKVVKIHQSDDNEVRSLSIKTKNGIIIRPLCEIYPLELSSESEAHQNDSIPMENPFQSPDDDWDEPEISVEEIYE